MGSDTSEAFGKPLVVGNNFSISVKTDTKDEADRIFNALSAGGDVIMPMHDSFWNSYFGMLTDKYNTNWMINVDLSQQ